MFTKQNIMSHLLDYKPNYIVNNNRIPNKHSNYTT